MEYENYKYQKDLENQWGVSVSAVAILLILIALFGTRLYNETVHIFLLSLKAQGLAFYAGVCLAGVAYLVFGILFTFVALLPYINRDKQWRHAVGDQVSSVECEVRSLQQKTDERCNGISSDVYYLKQHIRTLQAELEKIKSMPALKAEKAVDDAVKELTGKS